MCFGLLRCVHPTGIALVAACRDDANRRALLSAVKSGDIDIISSDHSPAPPDMKETESGDFLKAWGGISGRQD